jgi:transcriptional regulator with XRE-family HTH domain
MLAFIEKIAVDKKCQQWHCSSVSEVGNRLKNARHAKGLSLREFAKRFEEDFSLLARIEAGERYPPKPRLKKFAEVLSLTPKQLEALIAVERRGLDPFEMLPEIVPAAVPTGSIEAAAEGILSTYSRTLNGAVVDGPIPVADVIKLACGLFTEYLDFEKERIPSPRGGDLYGCLYPNGFRGRDRVVLVNAGNIGGRRLSPAEQMVTIAHEAGHYVLHYGSKDSKQLLFRFSKAPTYCREQEIEPAPFNLKEDQATMFAACLLMPQSPFLNAWSHTPGDECRLASQFAVTESLVRVRAESLGCE